MSALALKMLFADRGKYFGLVLGIAFSTMLMANQTSIFCGLMLRSASQIIDVLEPDIWVMDPRVQYVDEIEPLSDMQLYRVRSVAGVDWAVPLLKGLALARSADGRLQQLIVMGVDDASLVGAPRNLLLGAMADLRRPHAMIMDRAGFEQIWPGEEPSVGRTLELNDHRAVIVGICDASPPFATFPVVFARYSDALQFLPPQRDRLSFVLVRARPGVDIATLAARIRDQTGLEALTWRGFMWKTIWYYVERTGIPINFAITVALGFIVGAVVVGQTFHIFILDNLKHFASLKAVGFDNSAIVRMVLLQACFVAVAGYALGIGFAALFFEIMTRVWIEARGMAIPWEVMVGTAAAVLAIITISSVSSVRRVLLIDPAMLFGG